MKNTLPYRFSYDELSAAVKERYCEDESTIKHYLMLLIEYFDAILKVKIEKNDSYVTACLCISYFPQKKVYSAAFSLNGCKVQSSAKVLGKVMQYS